MYDDKLYHQKYYQEHKEEIKARSRARREAHKEDLKIYGREWRRNHPNYYKRYTMGDLV